ncbi:acetyl-CoA C-acyltransferase [Spiribacter halobius]|uniref:Acetyl-CoA C-acyltransferase n=1 Tax=Sediminicurvatus halobius TaxID=2182432 RepID=A0A2U2NA47_9GAMM|nr:acetyl-CoA C-acyltransferase [Spiribacter halobius]
MIIACRRTAVGRAGGRQRTRTVDRLGAPLVGAVLADAGLPPGAIDEVWLGNALEGGNVARRVALAGGLPVEVPAFTVDRQCASGLDTIIDACQRVAAGQAEAVLAGGVESCSTAPWRVARPAHRGGTPAFLPRAPFSAPPYPDPDPVAGADVLAAAEGITRAEQDAWAARSHARAAAALRSGHLRAECVGDDTDEGPRADLDERRLARLPPLLGPGGSATVGNVAAEADAAVVALVVSSALAQRLAPGRSLRLVAAARAGCDPGRAGYSAVPALARLAERAPFTGAARIELNEAFAGQALACLRGAGLPEARTNLHGGALAFGHPFGASGALLVCRLFHDLAPDETGIAAVPAMGGQGSAAVFTALGG